MTAPSRRPGDEDLLPLLILLTVCALAVAAWWPILAVAALRGMPAPANPVTLVVGLARHRLAWPGPLVWVCYAAQVLLAAGLLLAVARRRRARRRGAKRTDKALPHLGRASELVGLTPAEVAHSASRLRPGRDLDDREEHGVLLGRTVVGGLPLRMSWEDNLLVLAGPRVGKTTSLVIPPIAAHTGPVKTSSNRADVHDATRTVRAAVGTVWVCDPQQLVDPGRATPPRPAAPPAGSPEPVAAGGPFWWDPLADITTLALARELVQILIDCTVDRDARPDGYFHPAGRSTLVSYVFAAALAGGTLTDVDAWLGDINDTEPISILTDAAYPAAARQLKSVLSKPDRQRDGVLGTAQSWLAAVTDPAYAAWITRPAPGAHRPRFDPAAFVRSKADTLYLLSQHGPASAAAISTALNAAVDRAAIAYARAQPSGRLPVPLLSVLDEAANTIRDSELPEKFSHYGSRGMTTIVMLQSWSQGVEVWRERGMRALASAANITAYLGGITETEYLKTLSDLLGDRDEWYWTRGHGRDPRGGTSNSRTQQVRRVPVLSVAELAALPRGRGLLLSSGNRPVLIAPVPWMDGPHAAAIEASLAAWETPDERAARLAGTGQVRAEIVALDRASHPGAADPPDAGQPTGNRRNDKEKGHAA